MSTALRSLGSRVLSAVLPEIPVSACIPDDPYKVCLNVIGDDCWAYGYYTYFQCHNNCAGVETCYEIGCCI